MLRPREARHVRLAPAGISPSPPVPRVRLHLPPASPGAGATRRGAGDPVHVPVGARPGRRGQLGLPLHGGPEEPGLGDDPGAILLGTAGLRHLQLRERGQRRQRARRRGAGAVPAIVHAARRVAGKAGSSGVRRRDDRHDRLDQRATSGSHPPGGVLPLPLRRHAAPEVRRTERHRSDGRQDVVEPQREQRRAGGRLLGVWRVVPPRLAGGPAGGRDRTHRHRCPRRRPPVG